MTVAPHCLHSVLNHDEDGCHVGDFTFRTDLANRCPCRTPASEIQEDAR